jgi:hypothetical protein
LALFDGSKVLAGISQAKQKTTELPFSVDEWLKGWMKSGGG